MQMNMTQPTFIEGECYGTCLLLPWSMYGSSVPCVTYGCSMCLQSAVDIICVVWYVAPAVQLASISAEQYAFALYARINLDIIRDFAHTLCLFSKT